MDRMTMSAGVTAEDLERINALTRTPLTAEQVYTFRVRLCDNRVDRDYERFSRKALEKLAELYVGKCGLFDHSWTARGQTARLYRAEVAEEGGVTEAGEPACSLMGWAYMPRLPENEGLIAQIEAGIKKEVSVGCAVGRSVCSICGRERGQCEHLGGRQYDGRTCYFTLEDPTDAYEWSFVAVPAQPAAGVVKTKRYGGQTPPPAREPSQGSGEALALRLRLAQARARAGR